MAEPPTVKILCITGWCRNGSTIIGNILNEIPGFFHVGELHFLWRNSAGRGANKWCGCGEELVRCPVIWPDVLTIRRPAGDSAESYADTVMRRQLACARTRHTWRVLERGLHCREIREHAELMTDVLHAVAERMNAGVIVETSKIPGESALLPYLEGVTPYFVHLVRDPRAVAESWRRPKDYAYALSPTRSTAYWLGFNLAAEAITRRYPERSLFLRYEDFIADPAGAIDALLRLCGSDPAANPVRGRTVELRTNHTVTGNPDRFRTGPTVIRDRDYPWETNLSPAGKLAALALSWPRFRRYGYRYRGTFRVPGRRDQDSAPSATDR